MIKFRAQILRQDSVINGFKLSKEAIEDVVKIGEHIPVKITLDGETIGTCTDYDFSDGILNCQGTLKMSDDPDILASIALRFSLVPFSIIHLEDTIKEGDITIINKMDIKYLFLTQDPADSSLTMIMEDGETNEKNL